MADHDGPWKRLTHLIQEGTPLVVSGRYSERTARVSFTDDKHVTRKCVIHWLWGDAMDGTWFAVPWVDEQNRSVGNWTFWPTAWEASAYAESMAGGYLDAGAVQRLIEYRNRAARREYELTKERAGA